MFFFFFSSRRRHTRWNCDWSSDVCSSDLDPVVEIHQAWASPSLPQLIQRNSRMLLAGDHYPKPQIFLNQFWYLDLPGSHPGNVPCRQPGFPRKVGRPEPEIGECVRELCRCHSISLHHKCGAMQEK